MGGNKVKDIAGQKFGKLTAVKFAGMRNHRAMWECNCECGKTSTTTGIDLRNGSTTSCGCQSSRHTFAQRSITHGAIVGGNPTGAYRSWRSMKNRCDTKSNIGYKNYGGRGIKYPKAWRKFEQFLIDMGERPEGYSLERIDPNKNYSSENCTWIPNNEQAINQRKTVWLMLDGVRLHQAEVARRLKTYPSKIMEWRRKPSNLPNELVGRLILEST